ncbi:hypothetical protein WG922_12645 [Ramlibacter sp. AN1015]|uniref:hypothetical protein n=1 Tax=Ramlibacter sp. AN1015 TaxID=3133428 RepID=UPI0030BD8900
MQLPATARRVEDSTDIRLNDLIRARTDAELVRLESAGDELIADRLRELDEEWDVERLLQVNASVLVILGVLLGANVDRRFLLLPAAVFTFLGQHALQGWCPPIPLFRRMGVRTHREIARERYALKAMRGDFDALPARDADAAQRVRAALAAVDK